MSEPVPDTRGDAWRRLRLIGAPRFTKANVLVTVLAVTLGFALATQVQQTQGAGLESLTQPELLRVLDDVSQRSARLDAQLAELQPDAVADRFGRTGIEARDMALGFEDRVLDERKVGASAAVMSQIREALGADSGLRSMVDGLEYEGTDVVDGLPVSHVSGDLDVAGLASALEDAGGADVKALAGVDAGGSLEDSLADASFDLYAGEDDGTVRRLDLTLAFDNPDNALPPTRIRFSLTSVPSAPPDQ